MHNYDYKIVIHSLHNHSTINVHLIHLETSNSLERVFSCKMDRYAASKIAYFIYASLAKLNIPQNKVIIYAETLFLQLIKMFLHKYNVMHIVKNQNLHIGKNLEVLVEFTLFKLSKKDTSKYKKVVPQPEMISQMTNLIDLLVNCSYNTLL